MPSASCLLLCCFLLSISSFSFASTSTLHPPQPLPPSSSHPSPSSSSWQAAPTSFSSKRASEFHEIPNGQSTFSYLADGRPSLKKAVEGLGVLDLLRHGEKVMRATRAFVDEQPAQHRRLYDMSLECALCGVAVNEVEGFMAENASVSMIEQMLDNSVCALASGLAQEVCDGLVAKLPYVVDKLEQAWTVSAVCVDIGFCEKPFHNHTDPVQAPTYVIDLDLPPIQRWTQVCSNPVFQQTAQYLVNTVDSILIGKGAVLNEIGMLLNNYYFPPELGDEIAGCAKALGIPEGWAALFNLGYEATDDCTSIVAQTLDGTILHGRNMDFGLGMGFSEALKNMTFIADFQRSGRTVFKTTGFAGYVGALSGIRPGGFSLTIDQRFYPGGIDEFFWQVIAAIEERNASLVSFLSRLVLENENTFGAALDGLSDDELIADVYYIVAGVSNNEGAVITRNRLNATDVWILDTPSRWFEVETNYDHWEPPPWYDNRRDPANQHMNALGRGNLNLANLFQIMSMKPTLNLETTYTILAVPKNGTYMSWTRWCPFPCVQ